MINRRRFMQTLATAAVGAAAFDPEKLLWVPGQKTIFLPPVPTFSIGHIVVGGPGRWRLLDRRFSQGTIGAVVGVSPLRVVTYGPAIAQFVID